MKAVHDFCTCIVLFALFFAQQNLHLTGNMDASTSFMVGWWASGQEVVIDTCFPPSVEGQGMETGVGGAHQFLPPNSKWVITYVPAHKTGMDASTSFMVGWWWTQVSWWDGGRVDRK